MNELILLFGVLILIAGVVIIVNPDYIFGFLQNNKNKPEIHLFAVLVRLIVGALLIVQADHSRYPITIEVLGWIAVLAAVVLAVIGRQNFIKLLTWTFNTLKRYERISGILVIVFGGFIIHAFT